MCLKCLPRTQTLYTLSQTVASFVSPSRSVAALTTGILRVQSNAKFTLSVFVGHRSIFCARFAAWQPMFCNVVGWGPHCLIATDLERWNLVSHGLTVQLSLEPSVLEHCPAGRRTCHLTFPYRLAAEAVLNKQIQGTYTHVMFSDKAMIHLMPFSLIIPYCKIDNVIKFRCFDFHEVV